MSLLDRTTYAPLADGHYQANIVGFEAVQPDPAKEAYLSVELKVHVDGSTRPLKVSLFGKSVDFLANSMQRLCPMNGASLRDLLSTVRDSGLVFDITISHKDGYRNVDFFKRDLAPAIEDQIPTPDLGI